MLHKRMATGIYGMTFTARDILHPTSKGPTNSIPYVSLRGGPGIKIHIKNMSNIYARR